MKMQSIVNVDLGDEYLECENGREGCSSFLLGEELSKKIISSIAEDLSKQISGPQIDIIKESIKERAGSVAEEKVEAFINKGLDEIKVSSSRGHVSIQEYTVNRITDTLNSKDVEKKIIEMAKEMVESIKEKYDMFYAMQLLKKMSQAGMLKDDSIVKDFNS